MSLRSRTTSGRQTLEVLVIWLAVAAVAAIVLVGVLRFGIPALRHDWRTPAYPGATNAWLATFFEPWLDAGIGIPQSYPTFYLVGFLLWPLHLLQAPLAILVLFVAASVVLVVLAGASVARNLGAPWYAAIAVGAFCALNPWVYAKYVAGHIVMVMAYGFALALIAELLRDRPRTPQLILWSALAVTQIEFSVIIGPLLLLWSVWNRRYLPLAAFAIALLPIAIGLAARYQTILTTPYLLPWQVDQSVDLQHGTLMLAYNYVGAFPTFGVLLWVIVACAIVGAATLRRPTTVVIVLAAASCWFFATGTTWLFAPIYRSLVLSVPQSGIFRELYDLIAVVAVGYAIGLSAAAARGRIAATVVTVACGLLAVPWLLFPVSNYFVPASALPKIALPADATSRVALFPAFQPLSFEGRGSGVDPDAYAQTGLAQPINQADPAFPVASALVAAERGDQRELEALGVANIIARPYFASDESALRMQVATLPAQRRVGSRHLSALPILSIVGGPVIAPAPFDPGLDAVFVGDAADIDLMHIQPDRSTLEPGNAWVDVRLVALSHPELQSPLGGAFTSGTSAYAVPDRTHILAWTDGAVIDDTGHVVATPANGLRWFALAPHTRSISCTRDCALAAAANLPPGLHDAAAITSVTPVAASEIRPWLWSAHLPQTRRTTLRFAETYERSWMAIANGRVLPHVRLAGALNAWNVDGAGDSTIYLIEGLSAVQFALEILAALAVIGMLVFSLRDRRVAILGRPENVLLELRDDRTPGEL